MKAKIFYWKSMEKWYTNVLYHEKLPTIEDIKNDYVELPITIDVENEEDLAKIFHALNIEENPMGTKENQEWIVKNGLRHTSMSVGDIACINEKYFVCLSVGWKELTS